MAGECTWNIRQKKIREVSPVIVYLCVAYNQVVEGHYWSFIFLKHTYTHTQHWHQQHSIAKLGRLVAGFTKKPRDTQT